MMVSGLYQLPPVIPFLMEKIFEPTGTDATGIVDETPSGLVALDDLYFVTRGLRELMKCYLIFPASHSRSFL
jgi:hypothetical protein